MFDAGLVIFTMLRRQSQSDFKATRVIQRATTELTKTAIIVTVMFMICLGFDLWYYLLAYNGVIAYILNSPLQASDLEFLKFHFGKRPTSAIPSEFGENQWQKTHERNSK